MSNTSRIAKNTLLLYFRMLLTMAVSLYTSRVILSALGVEDYGIYNVVGGVVAMFNSITGALVAAISRFFTFGLGKGDKDKLKETFIVCVNITFVIVVVIIILGETLGLWFVNNKLSIGDGRMLAANYVFQFSLIALCIRVISIPYNAAIVAHERMGVYAYVSIAEALLKLGICFLVTTFTDDKLILYAFLVMVMAVLVRVFYSLFCKKYFVECNYKFKFNKNTFGDIIKFTGWSFLSHSVYIFNTQGVNILINQFFGVELNAARGIAVNVENVIVSFITNFTLAINPQITKLYAEGKTDEMERLVCSGAKYSFFLFWFLGLPVLLETDYILGLWLVEIPQYTVNFLRLTIITSMIDRFGDTVTMACRATGNIRRYIIVLSSATIFVFPFTYVSFSFGLPPETTYICFIVVYLVVNVLRLRMMHWLLGIDIMMFVKKVVLPVVLVTMLSLIIPCGVVVVMQQSFVRCVVTLLCCTVSTVAFIWIFGLQGTERKQVFIIISKKIRIKK